MGMGDNGFDYVLRALKVESTIADKFRMVAYLPWSMKPVIAITSDCFPVMGYNKLPYVLLTAILGACGLSYIALIPHSALSPEIATVAMFLAQFQWATGDILVEGFYSRKMADCPETGPDLVVFVWMGNFAAQLAATVLAGVTMEIVEGKHDSTYNVGQWCIMWTVIPTLLVIYPAMANFLGEEKVTKEEAREMRCTLWSTQKELVLIAIVAGLVAATAAGVGLAGLPYVVVTSVTVAGVVVETGLANFLLRPVIGNLMVFKAIAGITNVSIGAPSFYFFTDPEEYYPEGPNFKPFFYVTVGGIIGISAGMAGMAAYSRWCTNWRYRPMFALFNIIGTVLSLPNAIVYARLNVEWGISDYVFVVAENALASAVSMIYFLPAFLILSRVCPKRVEATLFAILAACSNYASGVSRIVGAQLCRIMDVTPKFDYGDSVYFENIPYVSLILSGLRMAPLLFLWLLPNNRMTERILPSDQCTSATVGSPYQRCPGKVEVEEMAPTEEADAEKKQSATEPETKESA